MLSSVAKVTQLLRDGAGIKFKFDQLTYLRLSK